MKVLKWLVWGFFGAVVFVIVFVRSGQKGGATGGTQTAQILTAASSGVATIATSLEGAA